MNITVALQVVTYLLQHRKELAELILSIEAMFGDEPGASKAGMVRQFIGAALDIVDKIESAWPLISPIFNLFVAKVKGK